MSKPSLKLTKTNLKNFKAFDELSIPFQKRINLIMGENSSGKSSIIKSITSMKQTLSPTNEHEVFAANGDYVELGVYSDYVHSHDIKNDITFEFEFHGNRLDQEISKWWIPIDDSMFDDDFFDEYIEDIEEYDDYKSSF
ncbi:TPA: AAA family ATPase, partial [Aeromonas hydrophila]